MFAQLAGPHNLPPAAATPPAILSVPKPGGGYDYYQAPAGWQPALGDNWPLPEYPHPNKIGVASVALGRAMPAGCVKVGEGQQAIGSVTALPGAGGVIPALANMRDVSLGDIAIEGEYPGGGDNPWTLPMLGAFLVAGWLVYSWLDAR